jgi:glutamine amidotransferase
MIAIVDYGIGNLGSIHNIIKHVGGAAEITRDERVVQEARGVIIPGVGAFDSCVTALRRSGLLKPIENALAQGVPVLGICVGMQMMGRGSEEGREPGLGWIGADVQRFSAAAGLKIPHMGWSPVNTRPDSRLFGNVDPDPRFYFVHSFYVACDDPNDVAASAQYGVQFAAAVERGNLFGVQFHPEKSHRFGMSLFKSFLKVAGEPPKHRYDAI